MFRLFKTLLCYLSYLTKKYTLQITGISDVCSAICSGADQRNHQSPMWLAFVKGIHRWPVDSPQKGPVTWKMFPLDDVIMTIQRPLHLRGVRAPAWFDVSISVLSALVYLCVEITHFHSGKIGISNFLTGLAMFLHSWKLPTGGWVSGIQVLMYQQCLFFTVIC